MNIHSHGIQLLQTSHGLEQQHNQSTTFNRFNCSCQQIRRECLKVLKDTHAVCISQNLVGLLVVDVANVGERDEQLKRVLGVGFPNSALDLLFDLCLALLPVAGEAQ